MVDEVLRRLEREATAGDVAAALRYARALEREGRRGEAACVLRRFVGEKSVRAELARYPAWSHFNADSGNTRFLEAEPVISKPRVVWKRTLTGARQLAASPFGLVVRRTGSLVVLDPETGSVRWRVARPKGEAASREWLPSVEIVGDSLVVWSPSAVARYDIVTGDVLGGAPTEGTAFRGVLRGGVVFAVDLADECVVARRLSAGRESAALWRAPMPLPGSIHPLGAGGPLLYLGVRDQVVALDLETGERRWEARGRFNGAIADASGLLGLSISGPERAPDLEVLGYRIDGSLAVSIPEEMYPVGLSEREALAVRPLQVPTDDPHLVMIDREDAFLRRLELCGRGFPVALCRDVVYGDRGVEPSHLVAHRFPGKRLWDLDLRSLVGEAVVAVKAVALLDRALFVLTNRATIIALTDLPESVWPTKR